MPPKETREASAKAAEFLQNRPSHDEIDRFFSEMARQYLPNGDLTEREFEAIRTGNTRALRPSLYEGCFSSIRSVGGLLYGYRPKIQYPGENEHTSDLLPLEDRAYGPYHGDGVRAEVLTDEEELCQDAYRDFGQFLISQLPLTQKMYTKVFEGKNGRLSFHLHTTLNNGKVFEIEVNEEYEYIPKVNDVILKLNIAPLYVGPNGEALAEYRMQEILVASAAALGYYRVLQPRVEADGPVSRYIFPDKHHRIIHFGPLPNGDQFSQFGSIEIVVPPAVDTGRPRFTAWYLPHPVLQELIYGNEVMEIAESAIVRPAIFLNNDDSRRMLR